MSIKLQLAILRKRQEELDKLIKESSAQLANEEAQQKSISNYVEQFAKRKSELAVKLYQEYKRKLEVQTEKVNKLMSTLEEYKKEYSSNEEKIKSYLEDISFYVDEQVLHLIGEFLKYVEQNEIELGTSITSNFEIDECREQQVYHGEYEYIPNGDFLIKRIITDEMSDVIAKTKDYYFERRIGSIDYDYDWECTRVHIEEWYTTYAKTFKNAFVDALTEKFVSRSFKLTINGHSFTLDLV